jgi:nicotianamine synthase
MENLISDVDSRSASVTLADELISQEADSNIQQILSLYNRLSQKTDLKPCAAINTIFGELVGLCTQTLSQEVTRAASYFLT